MTQLITSWQTAQVQVQGELLPKQHATAQLLLQLQALSDPLAAPLAIIEAIFIPFGAILDFSVKAMVASTNNAVVATTDL